MLLAKSGGQGGLTLFEHTEHVVAVVERMAAALGFSVALARRGAVLHDLGKGHPYFQQMVRGELDALERQIAKPHRHELSSLLFLPLFENSEWPVLIDMVVAHHKSIKKDRSGRGLIDLVREYGDRAVFERHQEEWDNWAPEAMTVAGRFGVDRHPISEDGRWKAFEFAVQHCKAKPDGWSKWRGLLMGADHFGSAFMHDAERQARMLYDVPELDGYRTSSERYVQSDLYPLSKEPISDPRLHTLVVAPTGAGKTNFLLGRCRNRVFYTLPFQASINAMFERITRDLNAFGYPADIRRVHATSRIELNDELEEDIDLQRHPGASVKVMTPYQIASVVFGTAGHEAMALDLAGQDVILDEVHTYNGPARSMVVQMVRTLVRLGCRVHIGTATLPKALADVLVETMGGDEKVYRPELSRETIATFDRHEVHQLPDEEAAWAILQQAVKNGERVLFISNQVARAQERFRVVRDRFGDEVPSMLIHSRYKREERATLERDISRFEQADGPCIVCATQVVEVSLDISFDTMITDAAPLDALVQRFGRINRRRSEETIGRYRPAHVIAPPEDDKAIRPYEADVVRRSFNHLPDGTVLREADVPGLMAKIYGRIELPPIDAHFMWDGGQYRIQELQHKQKSVLLEALEIDSEVCILRSDVARYNEAGWAERQMLHIPVPTSFTRFSEAWGRLEVGSYPLLAPDAFYNPHGVPLGLRTPSSDEPALPATNFIL